MMPRDVVVTWPKTKPLDGYLTELAHAWREGLVINYRVATLPCWEDSVEDHGSGAWDYGIPHPRCYVVYGGYVRGWTEILWTCWRNEGEVDGWPAGWYIVRDPLWHELRDPIRMRGFRGWRWFDPGDPR